MSTSWEYPDPADVLPLRTKADWAKLLKRYSPNILSRPLERILEVVRENGARCAIVETRYIDRDYRSEYSSFFSQTFGAIPDTAHRLHFFGSTVNPDRIWTLSDTQKQSYLGYCIIRPSSLGRVGRTVLAPPSSYVGEMQTAVTDRVSFFGQQLVVTGVPFAQQDTQFGRCAHVAAWICHYAAACRGDVSRVPMADFSLLADHTVAEGRSTPSQGLTGLQLSNLMQQFGLPPIFYRMGSLPESGQEPAVPHHKPTDDPGHWDTRAVAVICRYLNSGYPVIIGTKDHAFVIVGYRRSTHNGKPWIEFVRHDDQRGPYLPIHDILDDVDSKTGHPYGPWQLILAPVPAKLWLLPEAAERAGREFILAYDRFAGTGKLEDLDQKRRLSFRTFSMPAAKYKSMCGTRGLSKDETRELRLARLSRTVLVVEAIDPTKRDEGKRCVVAEAVFDSTSSDTDPGVLAVRVPGALLVAATDGSIRSPLPAGRRAASSSLSL